jgi:hypothetical protein
MSILAVFMLVLLIVDFLPRDRDGIVASWMENMRTPLERLTPKSIARKA